MINKSQVTELSKLLPEDDIKRLVIAAKDAEQVEVSYRNKFKREFEKIEQRIYESLMATGELPKDINFEELIIEHSFETMKTAIKTASSGEEKKHGQAKDKLAKPKEAKVPTSFKGIMDQWDDYRKKKKKPGRQKKIADELLKAYKKKTQSVWQKYAKEFLEGDVVDKESIVKRVQKAASTVYSRAKTIVETETTYYYNKARRDYYDKSNDVTHYLFVTVRDQATTKWCSTRRGLVYKKGTQILDEETPPIHWNCRSEILPLSELNPKHKKLIHNSSIQREHHKCEPLPKGWN